MSSKKKNPSTTKGKKTGKPSSGDNKRLLWIIAGIVLIIVIVTSAIVFSGQNKTQAISQKASLPTEISVDEAATKRDQGAFILDVRQPEEWNEYHIPGATLIPLGDLPSRLSEVPKGQEIVVVCRSGNRSREGRDILLNNGFSSVTSMSGGLKEWSAKGYETVSGP
jgi:rhodanese-related sulfurtransferase